MRATFVLAALLAAAAAAPAVGGGTSPVRQAWLTPVELTPRADDSIYDQNVAVGGHGNALAVWSEDSQGVFASYRPAGGSWQDAAKFDACGIEPQAAFDGAGNATVVWFQCTPMYTRLVAAVRHVDGSWTAPVVLSTPGRPVSDAHLEVAGSGAAVISWIESDGKDSVVQASVREPGAATWEPAAQVSSTGASAEDSSPAVDEKGDVVVGFTRDDAAGAIVWAAFQAAGGAWQRAVNLSPAGETSFDIRVVMRSDGSAVALWTQSGAGRSAFRSAATGTWAEQPAPPAFYAVKGLVADAAGDVAAAWQSDDVMVSELPAGSETWQAPLAVPSTPPGLETFTIGFDSGRGLVAVWGTGTYDSGSLAASRLPAGATSWTQPATSSVVPGLFWTGHTAIDAYGDAVVAYETPNGASVATVILDSAAPRIRSQAIPRTGRKGRRLAFAATADDISAVTFRWRFGDGRTATGASVTHAYRKSGRYVVTLVATDAAGHAVTASRSFLRVS